MDNSKIAALIGAGVLATVGIAGLAINATRNDYGPSYDVRLGLKHGSIGLSRSRSGHRRIHIDTYRPSRSRGNYGGSSNPSRFGIR